MSDTPAFAVLMANAETLKRGAIPLWTVYDRPSDYPDGCIARLHEVSNGGSKPTETTLAADLDKIRAAMERAGMIRFERGPDDEAQIVETWM